MKTWGMAEKEQTARGGQTRAGRDRRCMDFRCFVQGNEIFLIFHSVNSNLGTWMSPKARNEPGWRMRAVASGHYCFHGIFRKSISRNRHGNPCTTCPFLPSSALPVLSAPSLPCPRPSKLISVLTKNTRAKCKIFLRFFHKGQEKSRHYPVFSRM